MVNRNNNHEGPEDQGPDQEQEDLEKAPGTEPETVEEKPEADGATGEEVSAAPSEEIKPLDRFSLKELKGVASRTDLALLEDQDALSKLFHFTEDALKDPSKGALQKLEEGKYALNWFMGQHDRAEFAFNISFARFAIQIGKALNVLKALCKLAGHDWEPWADENIPSMRRRARQEYMLLGRRADAHKYADFMDKQKLMVLISATKDAQGKDRISDFLKRHGISMTQQMKSTYKEFEILVKTGSAMERIEKSDIEGVDRAKVQALIEMEKWNEGRILSDLELVKTTGGDVNKYLEDLHRAGGKPDTSLAPVKDVMLFSSLSSKWKSLSQNVMKKPEILNQLDPEEVRTMDEVVKKLAEALGIKLK
jgi:hypothetical protein